MVTGVQTCALPILAIGTGTVLCALVTTESARRHEDVLERIEDYIDDKVEVPLATGDANRASTRYPIKGREL